MITSDLINSNNEDTNDKKTFSCDICKTSFAIDIHLKDHMEKHKKQTQVNLKCNYCEKKFKLNFSLNRHIKKYHLHSSRLNSCKNIVDNVTFNEQIKTNKSNNCTEKKSDVILNLKLCKLNGVWKSKTNFVYKCNICFEKFHNENNLVEHKIIHEKHSYDSLTECEFCLKSIPISELNDHIQQNHNLFKCRKCNSRFSKKQNLKRHFIQCTKSSRNIWNKFRGKHKNNVKNIFVCAICGIGFNNSLLFKKHVASDCKHYSCTHCRKTFSTKHSWAKHMNKKCVKSNANINKTTMNGAHYQNMVDEDNFSVNTKKKKNVTKKNCIDLTNHNESAIPHNLMIMDKSSINVKKEKSVCTNITGNINSEYVDTANSNESIVKTKKLDLVLINNSVNVKKEKSSLINLTNINSDHIDVANSSESIVQTEKNDLVVINSSLNIKKENNACRNVTEIVNSDHIDVANSSESTVQTVPHHSVVNNCNLNIKKEKNLLTSVVTDYDVETNNSVSVDAMNNTIIQIVPQNLNLKQDPEDLDSEAVFSSTKKSLNTGNSSSQTKVKFVCNICQNSSIDRHLFALHMSGHSECNMHECIVCDMNFPTVLLWTNHMTYHQTQVDLLEAQIISNGIESNIPDINSENMEPRVHFTKLENGKNEISSIIKRELKTPCKNITSLKSVKQNRTEQKLSCNVCKKKFNSNLALMNHQTKHSKLRPFCCKYCDRNFSSKGPCTNHEKSHTTDKNKLLLHSTQNKELVNKEPIETQCNIKLENIDVNSISNQHENRQKRKKIMKRKLYICSICKKKFLKRCYWTNHMKLLHKVNPESLEQLHQQTNNLHLSNAIDNINSKESLKSKRIRLFKEPPKNISSIAANINLNNSLNESIKNKSSYCTICNKQCANSGTLNSHMTIHSDNKPYTCQFCKRSFKIKGPYLLHVRSQKCRKKIQSVNSNHSIKEERVENCNSSQYVNRVYIDKPNCTNVTKKERLWFACDVCNKKFSTPYHLITHRKSHQIEPYVCKICDKSYNFRCHWNRHLKCHYLKNKQMKKSTSNQQINDSKLGTGKLQTNYVQHINKFKCVYCKKEYSSICYWKKHLSLSKECRRHCKQNLPEFTSAKENYTKSMQFECHICKKMYNTFYNRRKHLINVHNQLDIVNMDTNKNNVDVQKKELTTIETIPTKNLEQKRVFQGGNRSHCTLCDRTYSNYANLRRHERMTHIINKPLQCSICGSIFKHIYAYRRHMKYTHKKILPRNNIGNENNNARKNDIFKYFCKICKIKFANIIALQRHMKTHIVNNYKCKECDQEFETNAILNEHISENHKGKITLIDNKNVENVLQNTQPSNNTPAKCKICSKILKTQSYLSNHMRLHSGIKPFKCNQCKKAFRFLPNLRIHERKYCLKDVS